MADLKFPLFLDLTGKTAVMVGGGRIALRRTRTLAAFDVRIRVIAPEICEEIRVLSREGKVECIPRAYEPEDLSWTGASSGRQREWVCLPTMPHTGTTATFSSRRWP